MLNLKRVSYRDRGIIDLYRTGKSTDEVAQHFGVSRALVHKILSEHGENRTVSEALTKKK
jgi:transposase